MKKLMILLFALAALGTVFADVITIGIASGSSYEPIGSYYGFHRSAAIYPEGQIGGTGTINTIAFKAANTNSTIIPIKIYMKTTTAATLSPAADWPTLITGLTPQYVGTVSGTVNDEWKTITLDSPFNYSGDNLEILIESNYGGSGTSGPQWYYSAATGQNQYIRTNNLEPTTELGFVNSDRPDIQFDISNYSIFSPVFDVNPASIDFGTVAVDTSSEYTDIIVTNDGDGTLNIPFLALEGDDAESFWLDMNSNPTPWALHAGESKIVKLAFNPTAMITYFASLLIVSDECGDYVLDLTGTGVPLGILAPSDLVTTNIYQEYVALGWTENNDPVATAWDLKYGPAGFDVATQGISVNGITVNPYSLTGLSASTAYDWYLRSVSGANVSAWAGPATFRTAHIPSTLPFIEDWENGQGFWTTVNESEPNAWYIDAADPYTGTFSAYVSNDDGVSNTYTVDQSSVTHIYHDIEFEANCQEFSLDFQWKCAGDGADGDRMRVFLVDISVTPVAGMELTTGQVGLAYYNEQPAWTAESITLPGSLSGSIQRLVFSWENDGAEGTQAPINLDDISLSPVSGPTGTVLPPNLDYPQNNQGNLPKNGFPFQFSWNTSGSEPDVYSLYIAKVADLSIFPYDSNEFFGYAYIYDAVTSPYNPNMDYDYEASYIWTVVSSNAENPADVFQWPPYEFTIEEDQTISSFPWNEDFEADTFPPSGWHVFNLDDKEPQWASSSTVNHTTGGSTSAFHSNSSEYPEENGWLVSPPLALGSEASLLNFWHISYFPSFYVYSGVWISTGSPDPNVGPWTQIWSTTSVSSVWIQEALNLTAYANQTIYLAFVYQGFNGHTWYVDDVSIITSTNYDAAVVSFDMKEVYTPEPLIPKVTVVNNGLQTASFSVTMAIGDSYSDMQVVTSLQFDATQQVSFQPFTPELWSAYPVTVTVSQRDDAIPDNNVLSTSLFCLPIDVNAYADNLYDPVTQTSPGPCTFNLKSPATLSDLAEPNPFGTDFLSGADWMNGGWYGTQQSNTGSPYWNIDHNTGLGNLLGTGTVNMTGLAYDAMSEIIYATDGTKLYTLNDIGVSTLLGNLTWDGLAFDGMFMGLAHDNVTGTLYAVDIVYNAIFTIDPYVLTCTPLGNTTGYDLAYAQDMAFDQTRGLLYLSAFTDSGMLLWVNTTTPDQSDNMGECYYMGEFQNGAELDGFAIPFSEDLPVPNLSITSSRTLSWRDVGASAYKVYGSDNPHTGFILLTTVNSTSWIDLDTSKTQQFYYVTYSGIAREARANRINLNGMQSLKKGERIKRDVLRSGTAGLRTGAFTSKKD